MNRSTVCLLGLVLAAASTTATACGEGMFNSGQGLSYQTYLAPRPALVLIYDPAGAAAQPLYAGLERAGHKVTVVRDAQALAEATTTGRFDVVIGGLAALEALPTASAHLLPVVTRSDRQRAQARFGTVLLDGAGLSQYLRGIHRALTAEH
jgi:hypothetical protein